MGSEMCIRDRTTTAAEKEEHVCVSDACQINDFDHKSVIAAAGVSVSDACQINDFDHKLTPLNLACWVSDACQINDFDHSCLTIFVVRYVSDACQINDFDQVMRNSVRGTSVAVFWIASGVCF